MNTPAVVINNITKIYKLYEKPSDRFKEAFSIRHNHHHKEFFALDNVNFLIQPGETVGIVGRNGSGKSTLLKILTGVLTPSSGTIMINGKVSALLELGAGFNMDFTGIENIYLNGTIMNISKEEMTKRIDDIIAYADIGDYINQPVRTYSSGMFVRLAFAVAINVDPDILIVDEALAVGDVRFQLKCMEKFVEFMNQGKTILFVSHDINSIKRFCNRTIWLNNGKLIMDGDTDEVTDKYIDFIKSEKPIELFFKQEDASVEDNFYKYDKEIKLSEGQIADIIDLKMYNQQGEEISDIKHGETVRLKIIYYVNDISMKEAVLGIAIRSVDDEYICGLNTKLDSFDISWKKGLNECTLIYNKFNLTGGSYYFDAAIFDKTATVNIEYKSKIKSFFVKMDYIAEGVVVLNHKWF
ncbi:ABC transporter ATP-binding protein [Diplocloster agilis]|uniref:ABC transporter ATP-binding protein n=1 Tax=Diplocloster agilis TaxID=2850323 RepID=A0A949K739_9FIRM|nr:MULTISPECIES: ABC transporter ATP-binding protein [Lachnospiraceae]MBU9736567.1 ABC transporter ATP-binding protein [Diplocloster agilis]MCU6735171.1 ABC transporter ATP-binding protein [Suonthocola fibrivorans]SCJ66299.1 Teichoic acids export ATP-binding protein TagH [uncultured Clostridium sp.]